MQLKPVRTSYIILIHQPVTVSSNIHSQTHTQIKPSLACLQNLIPNLAGVIIFMFYTSHGMD